IRYGGGDYYASNLINNGGTYNISSSTISSGYSYGIRHGGGTTNITGSSIFGNGSKAFYNTTYASSTATNNYWGSASGPYNAKYNPTGDHNNEVSDYVSFVPFLTYNPTIPDIIAPSDPEDLTASSTSSSQIDLDWSDSTDNRSMGGYRVERCSGSSCSDFSFVATSTVSEYSDTGLTASTTYRFRVLAFDGAGNWSGYSDVATETTELPTYAAGTHVIYGNISSSTTWEDGVYAIFGSVTINSGVTLTIDPGVVVKFDGTDSGFIIEGTLDADGTANDRIYFTSINDDNVGGDTNVNGTATVSHLRDWKSIKINSGGSASMDNVLIRYAGFEDNTTALENQGGTLSLTNSDVTLSPTGIYLNGGSNTITDSGITYTYIGIDYHAGTLTCSQNIFNGNSDYAVKNLTASVVNAQNNSWGDETGPYHLTQNPGGLGDEITDLVNFIQWSDVVHYTNSVSSVYGSQEIKWSGDAEEYYGEWNAAINTWNNAGGEINISTSTGRVDLTVSVVEASEPPYSGYIAWWNSDDDTISLNRNQLYDDTNEEIQNTATHELGHALGLLESYSGNILYAYQSSQTTLGGQDRADYYYKWP
ncbi:MAG: fibronectin type III domain-containing protein, partial [Candidatus Pacebacteria bacterium]|nr:fibronectin type III domain-containing protein [Candidatus Paceibacterota bacterium]